MVDFIPPPRKFRPIKARFWEREFGAEFNKDELRLLTEFNAAKKQRYPNIYGTVVRNPRFRDDRFVLIPAPWLKQDCAVCICPPNVSLPSNMSYVSIQGKKLASKGRFEILVDDIEYVQPDFSIKPEIKFRDFQDLLLLQWDGLDSPVKELLAFEVVSSPPILQQTGGLNLSLYDSTGKGVSKKILSHLSGMLPSDILTERASTITIPWTKGSIDLPPFSWSLKVVDADSRLPETVRWFLLNRKSEKSLETSFTLGSKKSAPDSIYDPPCAWVDQPTLLLDNIEKRPINVDPPLEITKYLIATHLINVSVGETEAELLRATDAVRNKLFNYAKKSDLPNALARYGIFDVDFYGKPLSIVRIAMAQARTEEKTMINSSDITKTFDEIVAKNLEIVLDSWPHLFTARGMEISSLNPLQQEIVKFVERNETKEIGASLQAITDYFFSRNPLELRNAIYDLKDLAKLYEDRPGYFRTVPSE